MTPTLELHLVYAEPRPPANAHGETWNPDMSVSAGRQLRLNLRQALSETDQINFWGSGKHSERVVTIQGHAQGMDDSFAIRTVVEPFPAPRLASCPVNLTYAPSVLLYGFPNAIEIGSEELSRTKPDRQIWHLRVTEVEFCNSSTRLRYPIDERLSKDSASGPEPDLVALELRKLGRQLATAVPIEPLSWKAPLGSSLPPRYPARDSIETGVVDTFRETHTVTFSTISWRHGWTSAWKNRNN